MTAVCVIRDDALPAARAVAQTYLQQRPVKDAVTKQALEHFITSYEAVRAATNNHDAALYVASHEGLSILTHHGVRTGPLGKFTYPDAPGVILPRAEYTAPLLRSYWQFLSERSESLVAHASVPAALRLGERTYTLQRPVDYPHIVGLDTERALLRKYVSQLFLYEPRALHNPDHGRFPKTILLTGPPGTGKSQLLKDIFSHAKSLARTTGLPFTIEVYDASSFSSYFGKSTKVLKQRLDRASNPGGVGIFCIEDIDMVLQSRDDAQKFHGLQELQQYLMNSLSGITPWYGNTLTVFSTNRVHDLDSAVRSRIQSVFTINPFTKLETHERYFADAVPLLPAPARKRIATLTRDAGFTGRDLESIVFEVHALTTREPSPEELRAHHLGPGAQHEKRYSPVTEEALAKLIAARIMQLRT